MQRCSERRHIFVDVISGNSLMEFTYLDLILRRASVATNAHHIVFFYDQDGYSHLDELFIP